MKGFGLNSCILCKNTFGVFLRLFPSEADGCVKKLFLLDVITPLICFFRGRRPRNTQNPPRQPACEIPQISSEVFI